MKFAASVLLLSALQFAEAHVDKDLLARHVNRQVTTSDSATTSVSTVGVPITSGTATGTATGAATTSGTATSTGTLVSAFGACNGCNRVSLRRARSGYLHHDTPHRKHHPRYAHPRHHRVCRDAYTWRDAAHFRRACLAFRL